MSNRRRYFIIKIVNGGTDVRFLYSEKERTEFCNNNKAWKPVTKEQIKEGKSGLK